MDRRYQQYSENPRSLHIQNKYEETNILVEGTYLTFLLGDRPRDITFLTPFQRNIFLYNNLIFRATH